MKLNNVRIQSIIKRIPDVGKIFEWYDIELTEEIVMMRLDDICDRFQIEAEDILLDLEEAIQDSRNTDWLSPSDDDTQWTEVFTEDVSITNGLSMDDETADAPTDMTDIGSEDYEF
jgi:hypothetical protein